MLARLKEGYHRIVDSIRHLSGRDALLVLAAVPILCLFLIAPQTFELSWAGFGKLGRGGLFFVLFFLFLDLLDFQKGKAKWTLRQKASAAIIVAMAASYFVEVGLSQAAYSKVSVDALTTAIGQGRLNLTLVWGNGLVNLIYAVARVLGANGEYSNSFLMATDYVADSLYIAVLGAFLFGVGAIRRIITPIVFSAGMLVFYLLDAFFPYGSLGPLQFWANFIVSGVTFLAKLVGLPIYGYTNHLTILGLHGSYNLVVYWPSVGVQSILIYSVVMVVIAAKFQAPIMRKVLYAAIGVIGTVLLNVLRIFSIAYYGYLYATSGQQLEGFHDVIGEVLFPIWIVAFLVLMIKVEDKLAPLPPVRPKINQKRKIAGRKVSVSRHRGS